MSSIFLNENMERNNMKPYSLVPKSKQNNIEKSIIAQLPQSIDLGQALKHKDTQIQRLKHALQFYRNNQKTTQQSINPFDFYLNSDKKQTNNLINNKLEEFLFDTQIKQLIQKSAKSHAINIQNQELKDEIKCLQEQMLGLKQVRIKGSNSQKQINKKMKDSQIEVNKLKNQIWSLQTQINKITYQNTQLKKALNSITKIKIGQQSQSILKVIQQSSEFKGQSLSSGLQNKFSQLKQQIQLKTAQCQNLKKKNIQLQTRFFKLSEENLQNIKQKNSNEVYSPNKKQNNRHSLTSQKKIAIMNSISEFQMIDIDRYQLKISQKNKQYEQLYGKFQRVESQKQALQDMNQQLQRERKFLADRLSEIQILQQGDEVLGEMQNKLVLMSTQLMRMGNLNRNKVKQSNELNIRVKQLIHKNEQLTKQNIEQQKIILNYKEQLSLIEQKIQEKTLLDEFDHQTLQEYKQQLLAKDKQIDRLRYLNKQNAQDIKTFQLKIKVFEEKIQRLEQQNKDLQKELKQVGKNAMAQSSTKYFNLQLQLDRYKNTTEGLQTQIKSLQSKITTLRTQINQIQIQKSSLMNQKQVYQQKLYQNQSKAKKWEFKIQQKEQELKNLKHIYEQKLISKNDQIRKIEQKIIIMQRNAQSLMKSPKKGFHDENILQNFHKIQEQNMILKIDISKYQQKLALLSEQIQRLNFVLNRVSSQNENLSSIKVDTKQKQKEIRQFKKQIQSLINKHKRSEEEKKFHENKSKQLIQEIKRFQMIEIQYRKIINQYDVTKSQLQIKQQQYNSLLSKYEATNGKIMSPRTFENDQISQKVEFYEKRLKNLSEQYQLKYSSEVLNLKRQIQSQNQKIKYYQDIQNQDNLHQQLSEQIIRLNQVLGERIGDIIKLQKQIQLYHHKLDKCEEMLSHQRNSKIKEMGSFIQNNSALDLSKHTSLIKNQQKQIILLNERLQSIKDSNRTMEQKLDRMVSQKIKLQHKVSELEYNRSQKSMVYHQNQSHLNSLINEIRISNQRLQNSIKQIEDHYIQKLEQKQNFSNKVQRQAKDDKIIFQRKIYQLQSELRRLKAQNQQRGSLLIQNQQSNFLQESEHQNFLKIKEQYQIKLVLLSQQVQRCRLIKDQKSEENQILKGKNQKSQNQKKKLIIQNESSQNTIQLLSEQIQRLSVVLNSNIDEIRERQKQINRLKMKTQEVNNENRLLKGNREANNQTAQNVVSAAEYQGINLQYNQIRQSFLLEQQQSSYLSQQIKELQNKIESQKRQYIELEEQNNRLIRQKRNLSEQKDSIQNKNRQLKRSQQHSKELLNEELRRKQQSQSQIEYLDKRSRLQEQKYRQRQQSSLNNLTQQIRTLRQSNRILQTNLQLILNENKKLVYQVQGFKRSKSNSVVSNKNQDNNEQASQLKNQNQTLRKELQQLQQKIIENNRFRGQVQAYQQQLSEYENRMKRMAGEKSGLYDQLTKIQEQYKEKCLEVRKVTKKAHDIEDQLQIVRGRMEKSNNQITILKRQRKQLVQKIENAQKYSNSQSQLINGKIKSQYYTKNIKMTTIDEVDQKQERSRGPSAHQGLNSNQISMQNDLIKKCQSLQQTNTKLKKQNQCYRKKSIQYQFKMNKLKQEFDLLSKLINQYRDENDKLKKVMGSQLVRGQNILSPKGQRNNQNQFYSNENIIGSQTPLRVNHQNYYSETRITNTNGVKKSVSPQQNAERMQMQKPYSANSTTNLTMTKNGSSVTFKGSTTQMNMNDYNSLKQSMHQYQNQISQKSANGQSGLVTLPIGHIHMLINQIQRLSIQNQSLIQELNDLKVIVIKLESNKARYEENLATIALRHRVVVAQAQRQKFRRQSFSPTKSNR